MAADAIGWDCRDSPGWKYRSDERSDPRARAHRTRRQPNGAWARRGGAPRVHHTRWRRHGSFHSECAERRAENVAVTPNARSVHKKKKAWVDLPISPLRTP